MHTGRIVLLAGEKKREKEPVLSVSSFLFSAMRINVYYVFILFSKEGKGTES